MTKKRHGQPRKRGEGKEEQKEGNRACEEAMETRAVGKPKEEKPKPLDFAVPEGGFDVAMPEGYEFGTYRMLKKEEFAEEAVYFEFRAAGFRIRAEDFEQRAIKFDRKADDARRFGSDEDRKQVVQLRKLQAKGQAIREELAAKGIDADAVLAQE